MNVRFSPRAVRCRIARTELETLLTGRAIALDVALPRNHSFRTNIRPTPLSVWQLESDPTGIWITIPMAQLATLAAALPSKEGIEHEFDTGGTGTVSLSFEVDVRSSVSPPQGGGK